MPCLHKLQYGKSEWCQKEFENASNQKKKLLPLRRQDISYPPLVNFHLGGLRWLDVFTDDLYDAKLHALKPFSISWNKR